MSELPEDAPKRGPGRPRLERIEEVQQQRRRRQDTSATAGLKMYIPPEAKDPNYEYRIVNDVPGRIHALTVMDDWEIVTLDQTKGMIDPASNAGEGSQVGFVINKAGQKALLLRKPKELYQQDKKQEQTAISAQEEEMRKGPINSAQGLSAKEAYVPGGRDGMSGTNTIGRGR